VDFPRAYRVRLRGGDAMRLRKSLGQLIEWERVCHVATVSPRRVPHLVPVCHVVVNGKLYFASEKDARKVRNLRTTPSIAVTVDLYSDDWSQLKGVMIQGTAKLIEKGPRFVGSGSGCTRSIRSIPSRRRWRRRNPSSWK